jgi:uncharacterized membrane protein YozB (DUF420 family)
MNVHALPHLNAALNATCAVLLLAGFACIRRRRIAAHRACMLAAFGVACLFLASYLTYHAQAGTTRFTAQGWIRTLYFVLLTSHTVLAAAIVPLAIVTLRRGLRRDDGRHRRIARWTLPVWLYVSVTGVLVYAFLYHWYPPA